MGGQLLRSWAVCGAAVAVLWLPAGCAGVGSAARSPAEVQTSAVTTDLSVARVVPRVVVTGPGAAAGDRLPATATATVDAAPTRPCAAASGFSLSLAKDAHGAPTPAAAVAAFLAGPQYAPGYPAAPGRWHVATRKVHAVSFSAGSATLSVVDLADKTWVVISGETCAGKVAASPAPAPSTTAIGYLDDGVHVMPAPVRRRAAVLLTEWAAWNARPHPAGPVPFARYYPDPEQSAVIDSASTVGGNLQVSFNGGAGDEHTTCGQSYYPTAAQSSSAAVIYLVKVVGPLPTGRNTGCGAVGMKRAVTITLPRLLPGRQVIDLITGRPVPRT